METTDIMKRKKVQFNVLTVVSMTNEKKMLKIYNSYKKEQQITGCFTGNLLLLLI
jgi:sulfatase maturation enzyme AslB (radical SAM superfamily)